MARSPWKSPAVLLALLVAIPFAVYLPSVIRDGFVSIDDSLLITRNAAVQWLSVSNVLHIFSSYDPELYIPLTLFTYQIEWAISGGAPFLFHLTNLLLHIGSAVFLYLFLRRLFTIPLVAFLGALIFALHPIHAEAVAWAAARKDVLSGFFFLASLSLYEETRHERPAQMPWKSLGFFLLALLSKVTVGLLPLILILLEWRRGNSLKQSLRSLLPYFGLSAIFIVIALFGKAQGISTLGPVSTILLGIKAIAFYLGKFFWPAQLSVIYAQTTPVTLSSPEFWIPALMVILLLAVMVIFRNRWRDVSFGLAFFLLTLLPNFANFWKNRFIFFASDRYMYLPSIGLIFILCSLALWTLTHRAQWSKILAGAVALIAAVFVLLTYRQTRVWASDTALYSNVLRWYPDSSLAANNLGDAFVKNHRLAESLPWFERAVASDPAYIEAMTNAGNVERELGHYDKALAWYEKAVAAMPSDPLPENLGAYYLLGELLIGMGKREEGLAQFALAAKALPELFEPYYNWGLQLQKIGRGDEAIPLFEKAISLNPETIYSRYHLAGLYAERGRLPEALEQLEKVVAVDPNYEKASAHLLNIKRLMGE